MPSFQRSPTPATSPDSTLASLSQFQMIAGAWAMTSSSILPQAWFRPLVSVINLALSIAALIDLSSSNGQLELFDDTMDSPLNVRSSTACGSWKSATHPTFGQTFGSFFGTLQNFVYMRSCVTLWRLTWNPSDPSWSFATAAVSLPGGESSPTIVMLHADPSHFPLLKPAFFM